jgi:hypothetical protein
MSYFHRALFAPVRAPTTGWGCARYLHEWTDDDWDRQMAADAEPGGKLHRLMEQAEAEA